MIYLFILSLPLAALAVYLLRPAPDAPAQPQVVRYQAGEPTAAGGIPRIIWSYWHSEEQPLVVQRCLANWARHNAHYEIRMVSGQTLGRYVPASERPGDFERMPPARQSDWLRLYFLHRYGGIWLDASIILTQSLNWLRDAQASDGAHYVGFYLDRYTTQPQRPVIDSWCMAAPAGSPFIADWLAEFSGKAWAKGDAAYLQDLHANGEAGKVLQKIASPAYMMIHVTAQRVLHQGGAYRLHLIRAEDSAYFYQVASHWRRGLLFATLLLRKAPRRPAPLIKLRGGERKKLEPYLLRGRHRLHSITGRYLMTAKNVDGQP
jgi:hypothetical protein